MAFDSAIQRKVMAKFATGVTVVTTGVEGRHGGLTANAVCSLSLNPPLVLVCVDKKAGSHAELREHGHYAVNILSLDQQEVSQRFAKPGPKDFSGLKVKTAVTGAPILEDSLAWLDCRIVEILPGGDHDIFIGEIVAGDFRDGGEPLVYFAGKYRELAATMQA